MAVDLSDLIDSLKSEVNAPGLDQMPGATDTELLDQLRNAFWEATLDGAIINFTESDGNVTATSGTANLSRELQQLVVFYAGFRILRNLLRNAKTNFRAVAGPVEYEEESSATLLKSIYDSLVQRRNYLLLTLGNSGTVDSSVFDAVEEREQSFINSYAYWVR